MMYSQTRREIRVAIMKLIVTFSILVLTACSTAPPSTPVQR
jgi:hypothetical protein